MSGRPDRIVRNREALDRFVSDQGWSVAAERSIEHGLQVTITDGIDRVPVNLYGTGKVLVQGKSCAMKAALAEWAKGIQPGTRESPTEPPRQNRTSRYLVTPGRIDRIRDLILSLPGYVELKTAQGPAEEYRAEIRQGGDRVTVTQYGSGTLMVQGLDSETFDRVCEALDEHLSQSFAERGARFVGGDRERSAVTAYLERPEAENEAAEWLLSQLDRDVLDFLYQNDRRTLLAGAGVRNALRESRQHLPDYYALVMPFARAFEGFLTKLAVHLGLATEDELKQQLDQKKVSGWLREIRLRVPDPRRYSDVSTALESAWQGRHKALHSDFAYPMSVLESFEQADQEIAVILRAMARAHRVFVAEGIRLNPTAAHAVGAATEDTTELASSSTPDPTRNSTSAQEPPPEASRAWIGVDESGKGDLFGPLAVAAVLVTADTEAVLAHYGVRDSKKLSDARVLELARLIKERCPHEILSLPPADYNRAYAEHGHNLNKLLAWGHAQVISRLAGRVQADKAISDQFGDKRLLVDALEEAGCGILLEQRHRAEQDLAVAAASILARAAFLSGMQECIRKAGMKLPMGSSSPDVKRTGKLVYRKHGRQVFEEVAKMHFRTASEIMSEVSP